MPESDFDQASYVLWYANLNGVRQFPLDLSLVEFEYVKRVNGVGWGAFRLGLGNFDPDTLRKDYQIQVWRKSAKSAVYLDALYFIRKWSIEYSAGRYTVIIQGPDQNDLLRRRIIAYPAGDAKAKAVGGTVGDEMKDIFNENFIGGATDTSRSWAGQGLTVQADLGDGPVIEKGYAWRNALTVLQELNEMSRANDDEVFFALELDSIDGVADTANFVFNTYSDQPGANKVFGTGNAMTFSPDWGTLDDVKITHDYYREISYVYAAGQGEGAEREIQEVSDTELINASAFGRIEGFKDARNEPTAARVLDAAQAKLSAGRPRVFFMGTLKDAEGFRYGSDWVLGDRITAAILGKTFDGVIRTVSIKLNSEGHEQIIAKLETEAPLAL